MPTYRTCQAARLVGVAPITLKRWLLHGRVEEVKRDRNGWRVFTAEDISRIREYAQTLYPPSNPSLPSLFGKARGL